MIKRMLITALIFVLGVAAVYAQEDDEPAAQDVIDATGLMIRPLDDVTTTPVQILDITSNSARLNFVGDIPLACVLVFGTTPEFGSAAIDDNMQGATMIEHNPVMLNLEPDTQYFYRVQGTAEDGTFYVGDVGTFRTLPESDEPVANLLSPENGAIITGYSSIFGDGPEDGRWGVLNTIDNNPNTAWSTAGDGDDAWIEFELPQTTRVDRVEFWTRTMTNDTSQIFEFTVTTDDGTVYGPYELPDPNSAYEFETEIVTQTLRFDVVSSNGGNTGAVEIAAYGEPVEE